jgi:hypothetical protein
MHFLKIHQCLATASLFTLSALFCAAQDAINEKKASYLTVQAPGALGTYPMALNDSMVVTGYYMVSPTAARAFLQDADGNITTFSVRDGLWTEPESINSAGDITGFFEIVSGVPQGFVRYADGRIVTFDPPSNFPFVPFPQAQPVAINEFGEIAGNYPFPEVASNGFRRSAGGLFTTFDFALGAAYPTVVTGLNASGTIVGYFFEDQGPNESSFILHPDGLWTPFVVPPNQESSCSQTTLAESINAAGTIAGFYSGYSGTDANMCATVDAGGFVRSPQGVFTLFNAPGPMVTSPLRALPADGATLSAPSRLNINQAGTTTGSYTDAKGAQHGFVREPDGVITSFDPPRGMQTTATGINDSGLIVGSFLYDWNPQTSIGFLRIPIP